MNTKLDIVERLRTDQQVIPNRGGHGFARYVSKSLAEEAADEIERLRATVNELCLLPDANRQQVLPNLFRHIYDQWRTKQLEVIQAAVDRLRKERDRYAKALAVYADPKNWAYDGSWAGGGKSRYAAHRALGIPLDE